MASGGNELKLILMLKKIKYEQKVLLSMLDCVCAISCNFAYATVIQFTEVIAVMKDNELI